MTAIESMVAWMQGEPTFTAREASTAVGLNATTTGHVCAALCAAGVIEDTGERRGKTRQATVYAWTRAPFFSSPQSGHESLEHGQQGKRDTPEAVTVAGMVPAAQVDPAPAAGHRPDPHSFQGGRR